MPTITGPVGEKEANAVHDVALVQAMLQAIRDPQGRRYYDSDYDGVFGPITKAAIIAFQRDHGFIESEGGHIAPGSASFQRMAALLPEELRGMMILKDTTIVYLAAPEGLHRAARTRFSGHTKLRPGFKTKVLSLFDEMYETHKITLTVNDKVGHYRTFEQQAKVGSNIVGPGESYHNFGLAADVAFNTLHLIRPDGTVMNGGDSELHNLETLDHSTWLAFWKARDAIATRRRLFGIGAGDRPHLEDDRGKSPGRSLVALLNQHRTMKWDVKSGKPNIYRCDLGLGGKLIEVGTALEVWRRKPRVSRQNLAKALGIPINQVKLQAIDKLKKSLRAEFEWAERNWKHWRPIS